MPAGPYTLVDTIICLRLSFSFTGPVIALSNALFSRHHLLANE